MTELRNMGTRFGPQQKNVSLYQIVKLMNIL